MPTTPVWQGLNFPPIPVVVYHGLRENDGKEIFLVSTPNRTREIAFIQGSYATVARDVAPLAFTRDHLERMGYHLRLLGEAETIWLRLQFTEIFTGDQIQAIDEFASYAATVYNGQYSRTQEGRVPPVADKIFGGPATIMG